MNANASLLASCTSSISTRLDWHHAEGSTIDCSAALGCSSPGKPNRASLVFTFAAKQHGSRTPLFVALSVRSLSSYHGTSKRPDNLLSSRLSSTVLCGTLSGHGRFTRPRSSKFLGLCHVAKGDDQVGSGQNGEREELVTRSSQSVTTEAQEDEMGFSPKVGRAWPGSNDVASSTFTVDGAIDHLGFGSFQYLLLGYAGLAWMAEAMELMLLSFVGPAVQSQWSLTTQQETLISSVVFAGMLLGAYGWGVLSDVKGRRTGFFTTAVLTFGASFLSSLAPSYVWLLFFRFFVGVGLGGAPVVFSLFMEFVPARRRGFWLVMFSLFWTLGSIFEAGLAWAVMPSLGWRWLLGLSSAPLALLLLLYPFLSESPRFYMVKDRPLEALEVLKRVAKVNGLELPKGRLVPNMRRSSGREEGSPSADFRVAPENTPLKEVEGQAGVVEEITGGTPRLRHQSAVHKEDGPFSVLATLVSPPLLRSTALLWGVFFSNAFTYYGLVLLTSELTGGGGHCGEDPMSAVPPTAGDGAQAFYRDVFITSFAEAPGVGLAALVVDRVGRKKTMSALLAMTGVSLALLLQPTGPGPTTASLFVARACIMGAFQVLFLYAPEVYPTTTRSTGLGIANSFSRLGGIICPFVAVGLVQSCQQTLAVSLFVVIPVAAAIAVAFFPQETSGRALLDTVDDDALDGESLH